ncbi:hypothetical protein [Rhizobium sp. Leaf371]|uniref:hypothetical protein n=1 Tax=Rhizobium sp. Leaf371 TaxID=1736355 RepID=UPI0012E8059D
MTEGLGQFADQQRFLVRQAFAIDKSPVALVKGKDVVRIDRARGVPVPDEVSQLGKLRRYDLMCKTLRPVPTLSAQGGKIKKD